MRSEEETRTGFCLTCCKQSRDITRHVRTHEKLFQCHICDKKYGLKKNLNKPLKSHNGKKLKMANITS